jgi:probable selenium-dependent hydroxylase accessory protein YqeC
MALADDVALAQRELVAFVGAGGKTTTMFRLGAELHTANRRVVMTTTTRMAATQTAPGLVVEPDPNDPAKARGPGVDWIEATFADASTVDYVLVEADGAKHRTVKAPAAHEPVLPPSSTLVVCVIGAGALNRVIEDQAHRPLRVAAAAGCTPYERLTPARAARLLASDIGGRKDVPVSARFVVAITNVHERTAADVDELRRYLRDDYDVMSVPVVAIVAT